MRDIHQDLNDSNRHILSPPIMKGNSTVKTGPIIPPAPLVAVLDMSLQLVLLIAALVVTSLNKAVRDAHVGLMLFSVTLEIRATGKRLIACSAA